MNDAIRQFFVRPQRQSYYPYDLGPNVVFVSGRKCCRTDFSLANANGYLLMASFYCFDEHPQEICCVYLHTHHGSRLQGLPLIQSILSCGVNLCLFDFAGYGNSEGQEVSLGCRQASDISCIIKYLREAMKQNHIVLWGRSMGAVAALLYLHTNQGDRNGVIGGIYDSPFSSLQRLSLQLGCLQSNVPEVLLHPVLFVIKQTLKGQINFSQLELGEKVAVITVPGLFITSKSDHFIDCAHSQALYKGYSGRKELIYIEKDHNQPRKEEDLAKAYAFIARLAKDHPKRWQAILERHFLHRVKHQRRPSQHGRNQKLAD